MKNIVYPPLLLLKQVSADYPKAWSDMAMFHADNGEKGLPSWPDWCYAPIAAAISVATENLPDTFEVRVQAMRDAQRTAMELSAFPANAVHLVVGRVSRRTLRALHTTIDDAIDTAGLPLLGVVPEDEDVPYCLNRGLVLRDRNYYAARAYENIAKRIMGQKAPLMKI